MQELRSGSLFDTLLTRFGGLLLTVAIAIAVEVLSATPLHLPNPPALFVLAIVVAAFLGGLPSGMVSAAVAWVYIAYFFSESGSLFHYSEEDLRRVAVWAIVMPATAYLVGSLNRRTARAVAEVEVAAIQQSQSEERARISETMRRTERQLHTLLENSPDFMARFDNQGRYLYINAAVKRSFDVRLEDVIGKTFLESGAPGPPGQNEALHAGVLQAFQSGQSSSTEAIWKTAAGERYFDVRHLPELDDEGNVVSVVSIASECTDRRHAELEHMAQLRYFESMDRVNQAIQTNIDLDQMLGEVLNIALVMLGADRTWLCFPCDPDAESWHVPMERTRPEFPGAFATGETVPMDEQSAAFMGILRESDGPVSCGPHSPYPVPPGSAERFQVQSMLAMVLYPKVGKPWIFGLHACAEPREWSREDKRLLREIGRRLADALTSQLAFRNLRESEARLAEAERITHTGYWERTMPSDTVTWSEEMYRIFGIRREDGEMTMPRFRTLVHPDDWPLLDQAVEAAIANNESFQAEFRIVRPSGEIRRVDCHGEVTNQDTGRLHHMFGTMQDITERHRTAQALTESHNLLNAVAEGISDAIFVKDLRGRYLMINSAGAEFLGKPVHEIIGKDDSDMFTADTADNVMRSDREVIRTGIPQTFEETATAAGISRTYLATKGVYRDGDGNAIGVVGISRDVTELKQLEEQLNQSQKMEAIGRLAGGIAHDFNNILTIINGNSELIYDRVPHDATCRELVTEIRESGERAVLLTRQLLAFSRKQVLQPRVVSVNALLGDLAKLLRRLIAEHIEIQFVSTCEKDHARVDPVQFEQAIINFAVNSRDAMPDGGRLTIESRAMRVHNEMARRVPELETGDYILVAVTDTGHGMDEATKAKVFEPFFTTKGLGKGTGLGLAMAYGFVKQSGGHVTVESELGVGTTISIYLPRIDVDLPAPATRTHPPASTTGSETILLVEDESMVRRLAKRVLQSNGYTVLDAQDGLEALKLAQEYPGPIHLLASDLIMPRVSGGQLASELTAVRPELRVLFMSGYTDAALPTLGHNGDTAAFLQKPFTAVGLVEKIREVLDD